ncbi:MAG TPA: hypothetical protein VK658_26485 [Chryseolinea sp.]|nr:hypothetical protein [Chryseolinea sp.]
MKTSWDDLELIERYLDGQLSIEEEAPFQGRLQTDAAFKVNVLAQSNVRLLIKKHHLVQLRRRAKVWHARLYNDPARRPLRLAIEALFKS